MKLVVLAMIVSCCAFASQRERRWNGFQNPNKIEKSDKSQSQNRLKTKANSTDKQSDKAQMRVSKELKSLFTAM